jgi:tRNA modification GTPase
VVEFATDDSIVAIATPAGRGGIGVVRISGPAAITIAAQILDQKNRLEPRYATFTRLRTSVDHLLDEVIATYFPSPHSYTGQDVVEISAHGSPVVLNAIVRAA